MISNLFSYSLAFMTLVQGGAKQDSSSSLSLSLSLFDFTDVLLEVEDTKLIFTASPIAAR